MTDILDIHTHHPGAASIRNVEPGDSMPSQPFSVGIHPWNIHRATPDMWAQLKAMASNPLCKAIGETGFDPNATAPMVMQIEAFERHVALSEQLGLPVVIHCVRSLSELIGAHKRLHPTRPWIWHGFRGAPPMARQLRDHGILYSFGPRFNSATAAETPPERLLLETDDDTSVTITDVAAKVGIAMGLTTEEVLNYAKTFVNLRVFL